MSFGRSTFTPFVEYGENFDSTLDYLNLFKLGGLGRLSGLGNDELLGEKMALARLLYYYRLTGFRAAGFSVQVYTGASLEAGNVYSIDQPITGSSLLTSWSLFVGADTPLGPLFLGYGRTEDRDRFYLNIGDRF
jgi:NTE family protein